jgi:hypothetical protein
VGLTEADHIPFTTTYSGVARIKAGGWVRTRDMVGWGVGWGRGWLPLLRPNLSPTEFCVPRTTTPSKNGASPHVHIPLSPRPLATAPTGCLKGFLDYNSRNRKYDVLPFLDTKRVRACVPACLRACMPLHERARRRRAMTNIGSAPRADTYRPDPIVWAP